MPRGVYDRSKSKKKTPAEKTFTPAAPITKRAYKNAKTAQLTKAEQFDSPNLPDFDTVPHKLYNHLREITAARTSLSGGADHNPTVLGAIDAEIQATFTGLRNWREKHFPTTPVVKTEQKSDAVAKAVQEAPVVKQATPPVPFIPTTPPAPLPFTQQAVQDVLKQTSS